MNDTLGYACAVDEQTHELLKQVGYDNVTGLAIASCVGTTIQALLTGGCIQLTYHYFTRSRRDTRLARLGVIWIAILSLVQVAICNLQAAQLVIYQPRFTAVAFFDHWLFQLEVLILTLVQAPIQLLWTRRAYMIWDRSRLVLSICLFFVAVNCIFTLTAAALGITQTWMIRSMSNYEFAAALPGFLAELQRRVHIRLASLIAQLVVTTLLCGLICCGIMRHKNGFAEMDSAISKIVFLCGESLVPVVILSIVFLVGNAIRSQTFLVIRVAVQLAPAIYFRGLMSSLVSRERVAEILSAEPIRQLATLRHEKVSNSNYPIVNLDGTEGHTNWTPLHSDPSSAGIVPNFMDIGSTSVPSILERRRSSIMVSREQRPWNSMGHIEGDEDSRRSSATWDLQYMLSRGPESPDNR
ncbi:MAG: hypothetical protein TREMPRED_002263 [Tremellales sp. Tagirdzhanova-0007]|nr:MAG: hypothetical protein TREMPRED_002263 [Tremellales sp. Tagirdzhanova-0007]